MEYEDFLCGVEERLLQANVPQGLWRALHRKLSVQQFDVGSALTFALDEEQLPGQRLSLQVSRALAPLSDVFLIDHMWTFGGEQDARTHLKTVHGLRGRIADILEIEVDEEDAEQTDETIMKSLWMLTNAYNEDGHRAVFVMDEVGCRLRPAPLVLCSRSHSAPVIISSANFFVTNLVLGWDDLPAISLLWPVADVAVGDTVLCEGLSLGMRRRWILPTVLTPPAPSSESSPPLSSLTSLTIDSTRSSGTKPDLPHATLRESLARINYTTAGVCAHLGVQVGVGLAPQHLSGRARQAADERLPRDALGDALRLLMLGLPLPHTRAVSALGAEALAHLMEFGAVIVCDNGLRNPGSGGATGGENPCDNDITLIALVQLACAGSLVLFTDFYETGGACGFDPVMCVGVDTLALLAAIPAMPHAPRVIDLCCGCGVQGLAAAARAISIKEKEEAKLRETGDVARGGGTDDVHVDLVDVNARAVRFAEYNAMLNGLEALVSIHTGNLYESLGEEKNLEGKEKDEAGASASEEGLKTASNDAQPLSTAPLCYNLILANPPYIPNPRGLGRHATLPLYGDGGANGEEIFATVLDGAPSHLASGGWLFAVSNLVNVDTYCHKLQHWWMGGNRDDDANHPKNQENSGENKKLHDDRAAAPEDERGKQTDGLHCVEKGGYEALVLHGREWSAEEYATLVHDGRESALSDSFASLLITHGLHTIANGVLVVHSRAGEPTCHVVKGDENIWQWMAYADPAHVIDALQMPPSASS